MSSTFRGDSPSASPPVTPPQQSSSSSWWNMRRAFSAIKRYGIGGVVLYYLVHYVMFFICLFAVLTLVDVDAVIAWLAVDVDGLIRQNFGEAIYDVVNVPFITAWMVATLLNRAIFPVKVGVTLWVAPFMVPKLNAKWSSIVRWWRKEN